VGSGELLEDLRAAVGASHAVTDREVMAQHETDWTGVYRGRARAVVRPSSTAEVAALMTACARWAAPVVVQGGNTGLVGGSVPDDSRRAVVVSTRRLARVGDVDSVLWRALPTPLVRSFRAFQVKRQVRRFKTTSGLRTAHRVAAHGSTLRGPGP